MALTVSALHTLAQGTDADAWRVIVDHAVEVASKPLAVANAASEVVRRDREIGELDLFLSSSGWDLWRAFGGSVERTSDRLGRWWAEPFSAKALLQRSDLVALNGGLVDQLKAKGLAVNTPDTDSFRAKLREAGFYAKWKQQIGGDAWTLLEHYAGTLA